MRTTSLFLFLFTCIGISAQNYKSIHTAGESHFTRNISNDAYLFSIKTDSSAVLGNDTMWYNYRQILLLPTNVNFFLFDGMCLGRDSWIGRKVLIRENGMNVFFTQSGDSVRIKTNAVLNESWNMFKYSTSTFFQATVVNTYEGEVLGEMDSIKEIKILLVNNLDQVLTHSYNNKIILLSKNHGLIQTYNFYSFPSELNIQPFSLAGMDTTGIRPLKEEEMYDFEVGAYMVRHEMNSSVKKYIKVKDKQVNATSYTYTFDLITNNNGSYSVIENQQQTYNFIPGNYRLSGQMTLLGTGIERPFEGISINFVKNGLRHVRSTATTEMDGECTNYMDYWQSTVAYRSSFAENLGLVDCLRIIFTTEVDEWGSEVETEISTTLYNLRYYGFDWTYGVYESPFRYYMIDASQNNSCTGNISFSFPVVHTSILWNFGDGQTSAEDNPSHTYTAIGTYPVSVSISTILGDTLMYISPSVFVGNNDQDNPIAASGAMLDQCNRFQFADNSVSSTNSVWTLLPDNIALGSENPIEYTFSDTGSYMIQLENDYGFCHRTKLIPVLVEAVTPLVSPACEVQQQYYSFYNFRLNGKEIGNSSWEDEKPSPTGDDYQKACNRFYLSGSEENILIFYLGTFELIPSGFDPNFFDPWYSGVAYDIRIDYNNNGAFETNELVSSGYCTSNYSILWDLETVNFSTPADAVKNTPLRMRIGGASGGNPCSGSQYDFSVVIGDFDVSLTEPEGDEILIYHNPSNGVIHVVAPGYSGKIILKDISGREVLRTEDTVIHVEKLSPGQYYLQLGNRTEKIIIR